MCDQTNGQAQTSFLVHGMHVPAIVVPRVTTDVITINLLLTTSHLAPSAFYVIPDELKVPYPQREEPFKNDLR